MSLAQSWGRELTAAGQIKCFSGPAWPPGTQKTSFFPGSLLPEVTAKKLKMHPDSHYCSEWLGEWEMIQASLYCVSSVSGQHTKHLYTKSALEQS